MPRSCYACVASGIVLALVGLLSLRAAHADARNVAIAAPPVERPATTPCVVPLFSRLDFGDRGENTRMDAIPRPFAYTPPDACAGPWAKIVLEADFSVDAGHQYDRTASIWLGGVALYYGTTEEPSPEFGPSWHVERDLTEYADLFRRPGVGAALVNNWLDEKRASVIHETARLLFYPVSTSDSPASAPDQIYAISDGRNASTDLHDQHESLQRVLTLPRNIARAYLDIVAQSQFHDEFWYMCLPDNAVDRTAAFAMKRGYHGAPKRPKACGNGAFREVAVSIDGKAAGLAPVFPWIYTGGLLPSLWRPTPGIETLNFKPYRMDLTPFAGVLDDGHQHVVTLHVLNANQYFSVAAALLVYRDPKNAALSGALTHDTVPTTITPVVADRLDTDGNGALETRTGDEYAVEGYLDMPEGRTVNRVSQSGHFTNTKTFSVQRSGPLSERVAQVTQTLDQSDSHPAHAPARHTQHAGTYTLDVHSVREEAMGNLSRREMTVHQALLREETVQTAGQPPVRTSVEESDDATAQGTIDMLHATVLPSGQQNSVQRYLFRDSAGHCMDREIAARNNATTRQSQTDVCAKMGREPIDPAPVRDR